MIKGNKGEWSEFYAFLKLLSTGKLYAADENLDRINNIFFPILKIIRKESKEHFCEYIIKSEKVEIHLNEMMIRDISQVVLADMASYIYEQIVQGRNSFAIPEADTIMEHVECNKISAPSSSKTDISMQIHDVHTGYAPICGFSIKSELGASPTLLNASGATNFVFKIKNIDKKQAETINAIESPKTKIIDRIHTLYKVGGIMEYVCLANATFSNNLVLIDYGMEKILADLILDYYQGGASTCKMLVERLEEQNPLNFPRKGIYEFKVKKFLCSVALGMVPSKEWNGRDEANGGYVIVKKDGDVVAYHIYNRDSFESYLLKNTKLERGSTTKHNFASIYEKNGEFYMNLNLQIRFL